MKKRKTNLYDRHQNKRALEKKARAKNKHFSRINFNIDETLITDEFHDKNILTGRVVNVVAKRISVYIDDDFYECKLHKNIFNYSIVVGDIVDFFIEDDFIEKKYIIVAIHKRKSFLARVKGDATRFSVLGHEKQIVASNIDLGIIVASTLNPTFHIGLIDRYLIMCEIGNIKPIICINKSDLTEKRHSILKYYQESLNIPIVEVSCITGKGFDKLSSILKNNISVLMGNSGVGKTSIINYLNHKLNLKTNSVSIKYSEGRHTTTTTTFYKWDDNSFIIDTPGIRNLNLFFIQKEKLKEYFFEFKKFEKDCKFSNCIHFKEPVCAVKKAVKDGLIKLERYDSYINIVGNLN